MKDYYKILGLDHNASAKEIQKAFRKLAREKHPDKSQEDTTDQFIEIYEAYQVLINSLDIEVEKASTQTKSDVSEDSLNDLRQIGLGYAKDYSKFYREILFWLILDIFFNEVATAAAACIIFGIWTFMSGIINLNLIFIPIGAALIGLGVFLGRHVIREFI